MGMIFYETSVPFANANSILAIVPRPSLSINRILENHAAFFLSRMITRFLARRRGFEPPTFWSVARRSIQLSYRRSFASILAHYIKKHNSYCIEKYDVSIRK